MLGSLKLYPRTAGIVLGIGIGLLIEGGVGETMTMIVGLSAMSLYALAAIRGWF
jgi:hypothetical protein